MVHFGDWVGSERTTKPPKGVHPDRTSPLGQSKGEGDNKLPQQQWYYKDKADTIAERKSIK